MKGVAGIAALTLALTVGFVGAVAVSDGAAHAAAAKAKKKCKKGHVFRKGKCRRVKLPGRGTLPPNSIVRASLSWDGPAYFDLQIADAEGRRAGYYPGEGILNEIPNAHYSGGPGGPGPETDTFTDDLFYGGPGYIWFPSPGNRGFAVTVCNHAYNGPAPVHVTFMKVEANGIVDSNEWTQMPVSGPQATSCWT
jgi:hypothetical protein